MGAPMSRLSNRVQLVRRMADRLSTGPLVIRIGLGATGLICLVLATPGPLLAGLTAPGSAVRVELGEVLPAAGVLLPEAVQVPVLSCVAVILLGSLAVALLPRGRLVTLVLLLAAFGWLSSVVAFGDPIGVGRLVGLSATMYLTHALAAFAAVLPYDAVVPIRVLAGWLLRVGLVTVACAGLSVLGLTRFTVSGEPEHLAATFGGVVVVGLLGWLLTRLAARSGGLSS